MGIRFSGQSGGPARAFDADVLAWETAVIAGGGGVSLSQRVAVDQLTFSLKTGANWAALDRIWLHAAENMRQGLIDLKARAVATAINSPTFTTNRGFTFDGATTYLDTGFNASTDGGSYSLNDAGFGVFIVTAATANTNNDIGNDYGAYSVISVRYGPTFRRFQINSQTDVSPKIAADSTKWTGTFHGQRTSSTLATLYRNGVSEGISTDVSYAVPNKKFAVGGGQVPPGGYSTSQIGASWIGKSLPDVAGFHIAMRTYMTAAGVP